MDISFWQYLCEKSKLKYIRSHYSSALTDEYLKQMLMTGLECFLTLATNNSLVL